MNNPPTTAEALAFHFGGLKAPPGLVIRSSWMALLEHARTETRRDAATGAVLDGSQTGSWLGATAYLILLDQLGKSLKPKSAPNPPGPSRVESALQMWSDLSRPEQCVMCAVRNALAHDFALSNPHSNPAYRHRFAYDDDPTRLVVFPAKPWNGDYASPDHAEDTTTVSLRALGDLVENVVAKVKVEAAADRIEIILSGGPSELMRRYGMIHPG